MISKQTILIIICFLSLIISILTYFNSRIRLKIGYVESGILMQNYKGMIELKNEAENKSKFWKANADTLAMEFENTLKSYEKGKKNMTEKEKYLTEELLTNKKQQYEQYYQSMEKKTKEETTKSASIVVGKLNTFIKNYGKENGYTVILGANETGNLLYGEEVINITNEIVQGANREYKSN
jgi:outer membrane protein